MNKKEKNRRLKYGALATVITVLGVLLVLAANLVMDKLSEKYGWSVDLTADERYAVSQTTIDFLGGLEQDVTIQVMKDAIPNNIKIAIVNKMEEDFAIFL